MSCVRPGSADNAISGALVARHTRPFERTASTGNGPEVLVGGVAVAGLVERGPTRNAKVMLGGPRDGAAQGVRIVGHQRAKAGNPDRVVGRERTDLRLETDHRA